MDRSKILFVITQNVLGGPQTFLLNLLPVLKDRGIDMVVAIGRDGDGSFSVELGKLGVRQVSLRFLRKPLFAPYYDFLALIELVQLCRRQRPDLLFLLTSKAGILGTVAGRMSRVPKIIYRLGGFSFLRPDYSSASRKILFLIERIVSRWRDLIVVNSEHEKNILIKDRIAKPDKIAVIYNSSPPVKYLDKKASREFLYQKISSPRIDKKDFEVATIVGAVSRLEKVKGIEYLVEAARGLGDNSCLFLVIGEGEERPRLEKMIRDFGLQERFFLLGNISLAARYIKAFDIFVLPSIFEGFSWSIVEAMFAGLPIVTTRVGGIPEFIKHGENGLLVEPADANSLCDALRLLLNDEQKRKSFGKRVLETAAEKLEFRNILQQWIELLNA